MSYFSSKGNIWSIMLKSLNANFDSDWRGSDKNTHINSFKIIIQENGKADIWCGWSETWVTDPTWLCGYVWISSWVESVKYFQAFKNSHSLTSYPGKGLSKTERGRKEKKGKLEKKGTGKELGSLSSDISFTLSLSRHTFWCPVGELSLEPHIWTEPFLPCKPSSKLWNQEDQRHLPSGLLWKLMCVMAVLGCQLDYIWY